MPIFLAPLNKLLTVLRVAVDAKTKKHLESLGIVVGETVELVSLSGGNVILIVKDTRIALDRSIATKIFVRV